MFSNDERPAITDARDDRGTWVLGTRFTTVRDASVTDIRYYKASGESGSKTGFIYNSDGGVLATTGVFNDDCDAPGWVTIHLLEPFFPQRGQVYTVAIDSLDYFSKTDGYYPVPNKTGALRPIGGFNGKTPGAMPKDGDSKTNYWIDGR